MQGLCGFLSIESSTDFYSICLCGVSYSPRQLEGTNGFSVSSERYRQVDLFVELLYYL